MTYKNREYKTTEAQRRASRKYYYKKKNEKESKINDTDRGYANNNKGYTNDININGNDINNIDNNVSDNINLQDNINNDIFQFNKIDDGNTHIVDDNFDNKVIEVEINEEQLKNILSIFVILYVYFRIFDFSTSNVIAQNLEKKEKYNEIIDRITNKCKATIEKYDYLKKLYSNIDDFLFVVDIILLSSIIEDEINNTIKKNNSIEEQQNITEQQNTIEQPINLFDRL